MQKNKATGKKWYFKWWAILGMLILLSMVVSTFNDIDSKSKEAGQNNTTTTKTTANSTPTPTKVSSDPDTLNVSASYNADGITFINNEAKDFSGCKFTLNQDYKYMSGAAYSVISGQHAALNFADFTEKDGTRFNVFQIKPKYLYATCYRENGDYGSTDIFWD